MFGGLAIGSKKSSKKDKSKKSTKGKVSEEITNSSGVIPIYAESSEDAGNDSRYYSSSFEFSNTSEGI
jgi:hypothetical protein